MNAPPKCSQSVEELSVALKNEDPPAPQLLPGTVEFEWVHGRRGGSKIIATGDGRRFLYRGQNQRHMQCLAQVWRNNQPSDDRKLNWILSRARTAEFEKLLKQHPMMELARENKIEVDYDALAQHYGIPTFWLDLTSSIDVACFFAVARFDEGTISPCDEGVGVVYRVYWRTLEDPWRYFKSISHSPASRPGRQHGWALGLNREVDFESQEFVQGFEFTHSREHSERLINLFSKRLFPPDSITEVATTLKNSAGVTMPGIRAALERDGCPGAEIDRWSQIWGERLCNGLGLDVYLDEEFALTEAQIKAGLQDAAEARRTFLSEVGFRLVRTRKSEADTRP